MRSEHNALLSEFHKEVLEVLIEDDVRADLFRLFERTTVTNKLRRIAQWDEAEVMRANRRIRPDFIVLTFLNYMFPELWNETTLHSEASMHLGKMALRMDIPIIATSTGPLLDHIIEVEPWGS